MAPVQTSLLWERDYVFQCYNPMVLVSSPRGNVILDGRRNIETLIQRLQWHLEEMLDAPVFSPREEGK